MTDIENAYLAEQNYIQQNLGTTTNLIDLLSPFGYNTLDDYFSDRFLYLLKNQNLTITHCKVQDVKANMFSTFASGTPGIFAPDEDITWALIGNPETFDYEKAKELNVDTCELGYNGGTIIASNSDFSITFNLPVSMNLMGQKFLEEFNKLLQKKGYNTYIQGNDILLDGNKIAGSVFMSNNVSGNFAILISLNDHSELISQLCKKKSAKTPSYLTGITKEEIEAEVTLWLQHT